MDWAQSLGGLLVLTALAWALSEDRQSARHQTTLRLVGLALAAQLGLAFLLLKVPGTAEFFQILNEVVLALQAATQAGTSLVFGYLGGGPLPFAESYPGAAFVLAFQGLPLILVTSALMAVLYYWRVLPRIVQAFALALRKALGVDGPAGVAAAANVFVGMVEGPLFVKPYMRDMSRADLLLMMTCGMATIAGTVMVLYAGFLGPRLDGALGHLLTASLISIPAAILVARLMVPQDPEAAGASTSVADALPPSPDRSTMDALTRGTQEGVTLLINVIAMIVVLVAVVALVNMGLGLLPDVGGAEISLERLLGWIMTPVVWLMGVPWAEAPAAGQLMGTKTVLNELLAYLALAEMGPEVLSDRSRLIMTYALCGFANFGSLGIMLGGLTAMCPERRGEIIELGPKTLISGTLATCLTGAVVGVLV